MTVCVAPPILKGSKGILFYTDSCTFIHWRRIFYVKTCDTRQYGLSKRNHFAVNTEQQQINYEGFYSAYRNSAECPLQTSCGHIFLSYSIIALVVVDILFCNGVHLSAWTGHGNGMPCKSSKWNSLIPAFKPFTFSYHLYYKTDSILDMVISSKEGFLKVNCDQNRKHCGVP